MARPLRIQYPAMYHVMNRGAQREDIFRDDEDRQRFLATLTEGWAEQKAERLPKAELEKQGWKEESLTMVSKSHPLKIQCARLLRKESTMSLKWIAQRLQMGRLDLRLQFA